MQFGPLKPVGLEHPKTGKRPYAVVQLRTENAHGTCYNMVGFQTKMTYPEQRRVFRLIPGLEQAEFLRLGSLHRNTFINSPQLLRDTLQLKSRERIFFCRTAGGCGRLYGVRRDGRIGWDQRGAELGGSAIGDTAFYERSRVFDDASCEKRSRSFPAHEYEFWPLSSRSYQDARQRAEAASHAATGP